MQDIQEMMAGFNEAELAVHTGIQKMLWVMYPEKGNIDIKWEQDEGSKLCAALIVQHLKQFCPVEFTLKGGD